MQKSREFNLSTTATVLCGEGSQNRLSPLSEQREGFNFCAVIRFLCLCASRYECSWPGHVLTVTPECGEIFPRSAATVCVSAQYSIAHRGIPLPWAGDVQVKCDSIMKVGVIGADLA